jgi:lipopolysaccharide/colanic/teichoic acid biosynthesis glycosyltransferase
LKVCFFNRSYYPDLGATGQLLTELAESLAREHGVEVFVVAGPALHRSNGEGGRTSRFRLPGLVERGVRGGVQILRARGTVFRPRRFWARAANYLSYFFIACWAGFRVPRPEVVVALTDPPIIGLAGLALARRSRARFVFLCQDVFPEVASLLEDFRSERVNALLDRVNRLLLRRADRVVALGETMRDRLTAKGAEPSKVAVIHNWADCEGIVPGPKHNPFSVANGLAERFVVMHSGNLGLSQNLETLVDAFHRLRGFPDLLLAIQGDGVKRADLEKRAARMELANVRFFPYQPKNALHHSFAAADLFVVSLKQGLAGYIVPSKLYGILAAGRPFVAAVEEACEAAVIARKHDCGLVARPGDPDDLAEKILIFYRDRGRARRMGENARRAALRFDRAKQVAAYHALFRELSRLPPLPRGSLLKRVFDLALSGVGLVLSAPLWLVIAAAVKLTDGGPVFFSQDRVGREGRIFKGYKFRSMVPDADSRFGPRQASEDDPRVTPVGRLLRATAMDELPQLWNIFVGDMSFVGPRALAAREIELSGNGQPVALSRIPGYEARHRVTPGLTGIAQIYAPRDIPRRQKFRYDLLYVRKRSFALDLRLIALSFWITFRGKWEHRGEKF